MPVTITETEAWDDTLEGPIPGELGDAVLVKDSLKNLADRSRYLRGAFRLQAVATAVQEDDNEDNQINQTIAVTTYTDLTGMSVTINNLKTNDVVIAFWQGLLVPPSADSGWARLLFDGTLMSGSQQTFAVVSGTMPTGLHLLGYAVVGSDGNKVCKVQARNGAGTNNHTWRGAARLVVVVLRPTS